ncbi:signal transducer and activator of transcription 6 [Rhinophrynus dorsalis]
MRTHASVEEDANQHHIRQKKKFKNKMEKFSVWHHVSKMPPEQFENVYHDFPTKVRSLLGDWLENQPWEFITGTDSFYTEMTNTLIQKLVEELEKISRTCGNEVHLVLRCAEQLKLHELIQTIPAKGNSISKLQEDKEQSEKDIEVNADNPNAEKEETGSQVTSVRKSTRSNKGIPAKRLSYMACVALQPEPGSWDETQRLPTNEKQKWIRAADEEITSLSELKTWTLSELPQVSKMEELPEAPFTSIGEPTAAMADRTGSEDEPSSDCMDVPSTKQDLRDLFMDLKQFMKEEPSDIKNYIKALGGRVGALEAERDSEINFRKDFDGEIHIFLQPTTGNALENSILVDAAKEGMTYMFPRLWLNFSNKQEEMKFNVNIMMLQHKLKQATVIQQQLRHANENRSFPDQMQDVQWRMLCKDSFECLENAQSQAIKRINIWKRQQQLAGNGATFDDNLLPMQERMEILYNMHSDLHRIMKDMSLMGVQVPSELIERINSSLRTLITSSLLVDKQPPQVLKTQSKFQASVNFLLGHMTLRGPAKMPVVRAAIITEKRAQELYLAPASEAWNEGAGEIENGKSVLEITPNTKTCGAVFKNMLLKKIKRCERKGSESVTEEKCAMLFIAEINLNSCNMPFHVHALSLPLVVIVHGNQDNNAKATILWDNAFSEVERRPFFVEEKVPWSTMCKTLNMKFVSEVGTKQDLQPQQFLFLAQKIFNDNSLNSDDFKDRLVSWAQFNKEPLRERNFTFWQWFDGVVELTKKCLKNYWSDGLIIGFISKQYVHKILSNQPDGTFLLRFSDSEIGGITIAHILRREDGTTQIQNIQPFAAKDLNILSLGDRVRDLKQLKFLYPNKPKHEVFEKYYSKKAAKTADGYTPAIIIVTVAG